MSFLISHVPPAHSFFKNTSIPGNTAKSLPTYFLTLIIKTGIIAKSYASTNHDKYNTLRAVEGKRLIINEYSHPTSIQNAQEKGILIHSKSNNKPPRWRDGRHGHCNGVDGRLTWGQHWPDNIKMIVSWKNSLWSLLRCCSRLCL